MQSMYICKWCDMVDFLQVYDKTEYEREIIVHVQTVFDTFYKDVNGCNKILLTMYVHSSCAAELPPQVIEQLRTSTTYYTLEPMISTETMLFNMCGFLLEANVVHRQRYVVCKRALEHYRRLMSPDKYRRVYVNEGNCTVDMLVWFHFLYEYVVLSRSQFRDLVHASGILEHVRSVPGCFFNSSFSPVKNASLMLHTECKNYTLSFRKHRADEYWATLHWLTCVWPDDLVFCDSTMHNHITPHVRELGKKRHQDFVAYFNASILSSPKTNRARVEREECLRVKLIENEENIDHTYAFTISCINEYLLYIAASPDPNKLLIGKD